MTDLVQAMVDNPRLFFTLLWLALIVVVFVGAVMMAIVEAHRATPSQRMRYARRLRRN